MQLTFDEYDELCSFVNKITNWEPEWYPEKKDIVKYVMKDFSKYHVFLIWITETACKPLTAEDKEKQSFLNKTLRDNIELIIEREK